MGAYDVVDERWTTKFLGRACALPFTLLPVVVHPVVVHPVVVHLVVVVVA